MRLVLGLAIVAGALCTTASTTAFAATTTSHGVANCQAALPMFDGQIRKRPLGIVNEGTASAYVTCDFVVPRTEGQIFAVSVAVTHPTFGTQVSCTLVDGNIAAATYIPKRGSVISWTPSDNGGVRYSEPSVSCLLPPGAHLWRTTVQDINP